MGKVESFERKQAKAKPDGSPGNEYGKIRINGEDIVAFRGILERAQAATVGSSVQYNTAPTPDGKGQSLIYIEVVGTNTPAQSSVASAPSATPNSRSWDDRSQRIEFQSMLKVVADRMNQDPTVAAATEDKYNDQLFKETWVLYRRFLTEADKLGTVNPT